MATEQQFWDDVRRKRDFFFIWWIAWIPAGFIGVALLKHFFGDSPSYGFGLLVLWFIGWQIILARLKAVRCPRCGNRAIAHPLFFMKDARCKSCGLAFAKKV
jgi:predicted RNA-binding Zn-ribbon protein involved in translation (DUF1610 family)